MAIDRAVIRECLLTKVRERGTAKSICPSEVARALSQTDWRSLMPEVRSVGVELVEEGAIVVLQRGQVVDPLRVKGAIRYRLRATDEG
ncbi:MAG: DUF3253 domain-containing protein [Leptolyngbyaceae cyanobacterium SL_7_1]|nr:DUF3253 domain-containing protein [Leptolyngbyaceae cyanobacterium SL_7_1]